ncbi:MAG: hypothetical protein JNL13_07635 [Chitinophagaceae bacterium]|nr:hypothetical protein [Chitinophagaceae bacterium]
MKEFSFIFLALCSTLWLCSCNKEDAGKEKGKGRIRFWTTRLEAYKGYINVVIDSLARNITLSWPSLPDGNNTQGTAVFERPAGSYNYVTTDGNGAVSFSNVNVFADCFDHKTD